MFVVILIVIVIVIIFIPHHDLPGLCRSSSAWSSRDEAGLTALKSLQRNREESNRLIDDILEQKSETASLHRRNLVRKVSSKAYGTDLQFDVDPISGTFDFVILFRSNIL